MSKRYLKNTSDSKRFRFSVDVKHVNLKRNRTAFEWNIQSFFANTMLRHGNYWPYTWFKQNLVIQGARRGSQTTKNLGSRRTEIHGEEVKTGCSRNVWLFWQVQAKKNFRKVLCLSTRLFVKNIWSENDLLQRVRRFVNCFCKSEACNCKSQKWTLTFAWERCILFATAAKFLHLQ